MSRTLDPYALSRRLFERFLALGGHFRRGELLGIESAGEGGDAVQAHLSSGERIVAARVALCTGAWSRHLTQQLGDAVPQDTERGYDHGVFVPLHDAVAAAVAQAYPAVVVPAEAAANLDAARLCLAAPGTELRIATNIYGDGITLVAVTDHRVFAYDYDPHRAAGIKVIPAADCIKLN